MFKRCATRIRELAQEGPEWDDWEADEVHGWHDFLLDLLIPIYGTLIVLSEKRP